MKNNNTYIFALTLVATLGGLLFGYDTAVISGTVESLRKFFIEPQGLPLDQANALEGFVVSSALIGCILGASFAGWISQRYGRKPTLILAAILFLLSAIGSAWPELFIGMPGSGDHTFMYAFVAYRILGGIGVGLASMVSPMYIAEVAPADRRGNLVAWNQFAIIFGMLVVYFVNYTIALQGDAAWLNTIGWRWMFASEIIPAVLFLSFLMFVPETPRYLVMRGRTEKALAILNRLTDLETAGYELEEIQESFKTKAPSMKPYFRFMGTWLALFLIGYGLLSWAGNTNALEIALLASFCIALLFPIRSFGVLIILVGVLLSGFQQFVGINGMPGSGDHTFMYAFVAYRILGGIGVGLASMVSPMYIAEVAPADRRGNLVAWNQFAIIFGMLVVYFVNYTIALQGDAAWLNTIGWRWMFASEIIPAVLFLSFLMFVPETPRYLVMRGRTEKALAILNRLTDLETAGYELEEIQESFKTKAPSMKPYFRFMGTWLALFLIGYGLLSWAGNTNALEIALLASFCIALLFPIRSFGVLIILVGVLLSGFQQFVGINVVLYYAPEIFKTMGAATDAALLQQIVVGAVNLSFTVLAIFTVDKFGRRPLMIIGALVMAVSMLILGTTFYTRSVGMGSLVCMLVYTAGFAMSWGPVCWVLLAEIFPNSIRSTVMSIAVAGQWIANFLVSWTFPMLDKNQYLTDTFNHGMAYWIYGVMGILAALFIWKFVPETKGKTLEEMEGYWKR